MPTIENEKDLKLFMEQTRKELEILRKNIKKSLVEQEVQRLYKRLSSTNDETICSALFSKIKELEEIIETYSNL